METLNINEQCILSEALKRYSCYCERMLIIAKRGEGQEGFKFYTNRLIENSELTRKLRPIMINYIEAKEELERGA